MLHMRNEMARTAIFSLGLLMLMRVDVSFAQQPSGWSLYGYYSEAAQGDEGAVTLVKKVGHWTVAVDYTTSPGDDQELKGWSKGDSITIGRNRCDSPTGNEAFDNSYYVLIDESNNQSVCANTPAGGYGTIASIKAYNDPSWGNTIRVYLQNISPPGVDTHFSVFPTDISLVKKSWQVGDSVAFFLGGGGDKCADNGASGALVNMRNGQLICVGNYT